MPVLQSEFAATWVKLYQYPEVIILSYTNSDSLKLHTVLILQRILPPYRQAFFQKLACSTQINPTIAYGQPSMHSALESAAFLPGVQTLALRNIYLGKNESVILQTRSLALLSSRRYQTVIAEFNPRIVTNLAACLVARALGLKFLWWGHGFRPTSGPIDKWIYRILAALAHGIIFYSAAGMEEFARLGMPRKKLFVSWNSINLEEIAQVSCPAPFRDRTRILSVGRLIAGKKTALLLRGFALALPKLKPGTILTLIGDGPERKPLEQLARQLSISDRIEFIGSIYEQAKLAPYFDTALVSVSPGYIGLSAIHSLAYGVPMLVADKEPHSPEIAAIESGVNAVFFSSDSPESLSEALLLLVGDPVRLEQMSGDAGRLVRQRFSIQGMVKTFEEAVAYAQQ